MASGSKIKIRRSAVKDKIPSVGDLSLGELAINTYDGKVFLKSSQTVGQTTTEQIITLEKQLTAGTGVTITSGAINIGQDVSKTISPTFAGATLNGVTTITQSILGKQDTLQVAGYVGSAGSVFAVGVSDTPSDGIVIKSLNSTLTDKAKLSLLGSPIILGTPNKEWSFSDTGNIKLPANGDIVDSENNSVLKNPDVKKLTFDKQLIDNNYCLVSNIDGTTDQIKTDGLLSFYKQKNLEVDGMITFFGRKRHTEEGVANIVPYQTYYIKTVEVGLTAADLGLDQPDPFSDLDPPPPPEFQSSDPMSYNITISLTKGGPTFDLLDFQAADPDHAIMLSTVSPNSIQIQRAPIQFQRYDEEGNSITHLLVNATFGDTYYDSDAQRIYIFANSSLDGTPQLLNLK